MRKKIVFLAVLPVIIASILFVTSTTRMYAMAGHNHSEMEHSTSKTTKTEKAKPKKVTIVAEVIDSTCFITHDMRGKDHKKCAKMCAEKGIPLALFEEKTGKIYLVLSDMNYNPNDKLKDYIADIVKVTGTLYTKGGIPSIQIEKIERVK
ncbi:MAG: hypothetical protein AB1546_07095 [bacterium]